MELSPGKSVDVAQSTPLLEQSTEEFVQSAEKKMDGNGSDKGGVYLNCIRECRKIESFVRARQCARAAWLL